MQPTSSFFQVKRFIGLLALAGLLIAGNRVDAKNEIASSATHPAAAKVSTATKQTASAKTSTYKNAAIKIRGNGEFFGDCEVIIASRGMRIKTKIGYMMWSADQPDKYCEVNPENKTYWVLNQDQWVEDTRDDFPEVPKFTRVSSEPALIGSTKCLLNTGYHRDGAGSEEKVMQFYTLPDYSIGGDAQQAWTRALGLHGISVFPLGASQFMVRQW